MSCVFTHLLSISVSLSVSVDYQEAFIFEMPIDQCYPIKLYTYLFQGPRGRFA